MADYTSCVNCGFESNTDYCSNCGQKKHVRPITWKGLIAELSSRWLGMDNRIARTFVDMWRSPSLVIEQYLSGNRIRYVGPLSYLVITSALFIFSFSIFGVSTEDYLRDSSAAFQPEQTEQSQQQFMESYFQRISENFRLVVASLIPFMALSLKWFFEKNNYLEHFLTVTYITSQMLWLSVIQVAVFGLTGFNLQYPFFVVNILFFVYVIGNVHPRQSKVTQYLIPFISWIVGYLVFFFAAVILAFIAIIIVASQGGL